MFAVGDRVQTVTNDPLSGLIGTVIEIPEHPGFNIRLDEDGSDGALLHFWEEELRKVEA